MFHYLSVGVYVRVPQTNIALLHTTTNSWRAAQTRPPAGRAQGASAKQRS